MIDTAEESDTTQPKEELWFLATAAPPAFYNGLLGKSSRSLDREGLWWEWRLHSLPGALSDIIVLLIGFDINKKAFLST